MTAQEKHNVTEYLFKSRKKLLTRIKELKELTQPIEPDCAIGRVSRMDAIINKSVNETALRTAEDKLKNINIALERIDDVKFGICISCGKPIPIQRLMVMPESSKCVRCAGR
ncbi:MAG: TraR/DksA family transcriptional regulator [Bacteroidetes bacterium]|nr:MAG: TraR/DksA family transcriptional regulator [Bacteroidota bacterium]